jgi:uncharacterized C2H2 Zn-finger protein
MEENLSLSRGFDDISYIFPRQERYEKPPPAPKHPPKPKKKRPKTMPSKQVSAKKASLTRISSATFWCKLCPIRSCCYKSKALPGLVRHLSSDHQLEYDLNHQQQCPLCDMKVYRTKGSYFKHISKSHPHQCKQLRKRLYEQTAMDVEHLMQIAAEATEMVIVPNAPVVEVIKVT